MEKLLSQHGVKPTPNRLLVARELSSAGRPLSLMELEGRLETVLDSHGIVYDKTEVWIAEERLYEVLYSMEVLCNEQQDQIQP